MSHKNQWKFLKMVAMLIQYADLLGYELTGGDLYRDERCHYGHPNSYHRRRLAIDLNLFIDGVYQTNTASHAALGEFWEGLDPQNKWGGSFDDGNHYQYGRTA